MEEVEIVEEKKETLDTDTKVFCNCWQTVRDLFVPEMPNVPTLLSNLGDEGEIAVFYYPKSGLHHFAYVLSSDVNTITIAEGNLVHCQYSERTISRDNYALLGFYKL